MQTSFAPPHPPPHDICATYQPAHSVFCDTGYPNKDSLRGPRRDEQINSQEKETGVHAHAYGKFATLAVAVKETMALDATLSDGK